MLFFLHLMESLKNEKCVLESPLKVLECFIKKGYEHYDAALVLLLVNPIHFFS